MFILLVRFPVNNRLLVKFLGSRKLYLDFQLCGELTSLTPVLSKGQLHINKSKSLVISRIWGGRGRHVCMCSPSWSNLLKPFLGKDFGGTDTWNICSIEVHWNLLFIGHQILTTGACMLHWIGSFRYPYFATKPKLWKVSTFLPRGRMILI